MARHYELRCVCDYLHTGAQAVNTPANPTPNQVGGELETDERGEIILAEVFPPVTGAGVEEELRKIVPVLDGENFGKYISLSGIRATNMAPPRERIMGYGGRIYYFGSPGNSNPMENTTLKFKQNVTVQTFCGPTIPITQNYRVRLYAVVYREDEIPGVFGTMTFPNALVYERRRNRLITVNKAPIVVNAKTWLTLPGGKDQAIPKINPFVRYAYNLLATNGQQGDYRFSFKDGTVSDEQENLHFEFDDLDALFVEGLGIKADIGGHLARTGFRIDGDYHPKGPTQLTHLFPTSPGINPLNFGYLYPNAPIDHPYYIAVPKLPQPYLIWNEIGYPLIRDDGLGVVAANAVIMALTGIRIEMRGG